MAVVAVVVPLLSTLADAVVDLIFAVDWVFVIELAADVVHQPATADAVADWIFAAKLVA